MTRYERNIKEYSVEKLLNKELERCWVERFIPSIVYMHPRDKRELLERSFENWVYRTPSDGRPQILVYESDFGRVEIKATEDVPEGHIIVV